MKIKAIYDTLDDVPEQFRELYSEKDGKFHLTGVEGIKTDADVSALRNALTKEKDDHKATKAKFKKFEHLDMDKIQSDLDELEELRIKADGKVDDKKLEELAEARANKKLAPVQRELDKSKERVAELEKSNGELLGTITRGKVEGAIRKAAEAKKVLGTAIDDVVVIGQNLFEVTDDGKIVTRDNVGVTPGIEADVWLTDMQEKRPHWWPASQGGGANGGGNAGKFTENPWSDANWNLTKQGEVLRTQGTDKANQMAKAAGTTVGGARPQKKTG